MQTKFSTLCAAAGTALALCTAATMNATAASAPIPDYIKAAVAEPTGPIAIGSAMPIASRNR